MKDTYKFRLLTEDQVEEWFNIKKSTLQKMRHTNHKNPLPYSKIGGSVRYREDMLIRWLEHNTFDDAAQERYFRKGR